MFLSFQLDPFERRNLEEKEREREREGIGTSRAAVNLEFV